MWEENPIKLCCEPEQKVFFYKLVFAFELGFFCLFFFLLLSEEETTHLCKSLPCWWGHLGRVEVLPSTWPLLALRHDAFIAYFWNSHGLFLRCGFLFVWSIVWEFIANPSEGDDSLVDPSVHPVHAHHAILVAIRARFRALLLFPTLPRLPSSRFSSPQADPRSKDDALTLSPSKDLLSVRKPSVGRTHSLPNDSYMFQPPYSSPSPASLGDRRPAHHKSQSGTHTSPSWDKSRIFQ